MANYEAPILQSSILTTFRTSAFLFANAVIPRRIMIYELELGQSGNLASTDNQVQWDVSRALTNSAAGAAVVPNLNDPSDTSPLSGYLNNLTAFPTYTTVNNGLSIKQWGINQRGSYRWRALDDGDNILVPAVIANAVGAQVLMAVPTGGQSAVGNLSFVER